MVQAERQFAIKLEGQEGIEAAPSASDVLTSIEDPTVTPNIAFSEARPAAGTHARNRAIPGRAEQGSAVSAFLVGSRNASNLLLPTALDSAFQAAGMQRATVANIIYVTLSTQVGDFVRGETVTWPGPNSGVVQNYAIKRGTTTIVLVLESTADLPTTNGATLTGGTSGATAVGVGDAVIRLPYLYRPVTRTTFKVTASHASWPSFAAVAGDVLVRCNSAATAIVEGWNGTAARIVAVTGSNPKTFECESLGVDKFADGQSVTYYDVSAGTLYDPGTAATIDSGGVTSGAGPTATIWLPTAGILDKLLGARGTFGLAGQAGEGVRANFDFTGQMQTPINGGLFSGVTYIGAEEVPRLELAACTIDGWPFPTQTLEYNHNGTLTARIDLHKANGVGAVRRTGRDPTFTTDPIMPVPALYDMVGKSIGNIAVVARFQVGYAAGNMFVGEFPAGQLMNVGRGNRDGEVIANIELKGRVVSGQEDHDFRLYAL